LALCDGFRKGQKVLVLSGLFLDLVGTLERLDHHGHVRVLLEMMDTSQLTGPGFCRRHKICKVVPIEKSNQNHMIGLVMKPLVWSYACIA
jgi:hypothetical protein